VGQRLKQVHLAAHFPGVNNTTVWSDPAAGSHIEFDSFAQFARIAEGVLARGGDPPEPPATPRVRCSQ